MSAGAVARNEPAVAAATLANGTYERRRRPWDARVPSSPPGEAGSAAYFRPALPVVEPPALGPRADAWRHRRRDDVRVLHPGPDSLMIRSARPGDAPSIFELLESFAARGRLLRRTLGQVRGMIDDFVVAVDQHGRVLGCGALRVYSDTLAEVAALAVEEARHGRGVGARIVRVLEAEATALGVRRLFALTLEDGFFRRLGFRAADVREFPEKIARDCTRCEHRFHCVEIAVTRELRSEDSTRRRIASET